jgi:crotonobetaine/carnitine-CoA ligase
MTLVVDPDAPVTSAELLERRAADVPSRTFLRYGDQAFTFAEAADRVARLAGGFHERLGVGVGDRVCLMLPNGPDFVFATLALAWLGAVEVPLNTALKGEVLRHQLVDSDPVAVVVHAGLAQRLRDAADGLEFTVVVAGDAENPEPFDALWHGAARSRAAVGVHSMAAIMYTSGTTGHAKGVEVTHAHAHRFVVDWSVAVGFRESDVILTPLPLFHMIARTLGVLPALAFGATVCVVERFSARAFWQQAREVDATIVHGIFGMVPILLNQPPSELDREHRVRKFYIGPSGLNAAFKERFGVEIVECYGSTETGVVTMFGPEDEIRPGSCGKPNARTYEVAIFDENDQPVAPGEIGEFVVRPHAPGSVLTGYFRRPQETVAAFRNLWYHTGDLGKFDDDGYAYFVDRKKDAIRRRGENITSADVERAVNAHPSVLETAVIAVPSELGEDDVMACVVLQPGASVDLAELVGFLDERLPYFMVPRYFEILDELPKTANEKVQKVQLRERGAHGVTSKTWDREAAGIQVTR